MEQGEIRAGRDVGEKYLSMLEFVRRESARFDKLGTPYANRVIKLKRDDIVKLIAEWIKLISPPQDMETELLISHAVACSQGPDPEKFFRGKPVYNVHIEQDYYAALTSVD